MAQKSQGGPRGTPKLVDVVLLVVWVLARKDARSLPGAVLSLAIKQKLDPVVEGIVICAKSGAQQPVEREAGGE